MTYNLFHNNNDKRLLAAVIILILIVCVLCGCYTDKAAANAVTKAILLKPTVAAKLTRAAFPCITTKADTTYHVVDTSIMVDCPPFPQDVTDYFTTNHDTLFLKKVTTQRVSVPVTVKVPGKTITIKIKDSADTYILAAAYITEHEKSTELSRKLDRYGSLLYSLKRLFTFWQVWLIIITLGAYWQRHKLMMLMTGIPSVKR